MGFPIFPITSKKMVDAIRQEAGVFRVYSRAAAPCGGGQPFRITAIMMAAKLMMATDPTITLASICAEM